MVHGMEAAIRVIEQHQTDADGVEDVVLAVLVLETAGVAAPDALNLLDSLGVRDVEQGHRRV